MKRVILATAVASIFLFSTGVGADGKDSLPHGEQLEQSEMQHSGEDHSSGNGHFETEVSTERVNEDQKDINTNMEQEHKDSPTGHTESDPSHSTNEHGTAGHSDNHGTEESGEGHHGPVIETPPNYKVLGTFGAINLAFILIGIWNKWFRRNKGVASWQS